MKKAKHSNNNEEMIFLPDFCDIRMVFAVVVLAELMAFAILLSTPYQQPLGWDRLGTLSLYIQWVALGSIGVLCFLRKWLVQLSDTVAGFASYLIVLLVTLTVSEVAYWVMLDTGLPQNQDKHLDFLLRTMGISAILSGISLRVIYLQHQQKIHIQAHANARIQALHARIRPHFLFNSMNTIAALIRTEPDHAEEAVEDLSDLFRASLGQNSQLISLSEEVQIARRYLHIEQLRLGDRLKVEWHLDELPDNALLPVLTLQPLLENAIFHGIEMIADGGEIQLHGSRHGKMLSIVITNPCLPPEQSRRSGGNQMAMDNIHERLQIAFGRHAGLKIQRQQRSCQLEIVFPFTEQS
jgi:two-component system sensor histidine kinase AlgZ